MRQHFLIFPKRERLRRIAQRDLGIVVHLHQHSVGARRDTRAGQRRDHVIFSGGVRRVHYHRQMRDTPDGGDRRQIEGVPRMQRKGPHPAFTQDHLIISLRHDVFRREKPFIERRGHAALQQHRQLRTARAPQERKILHVTRADLNDVAIFFDEVDAGHIERFRHDLQPKFLANLRHDLEAFLAQAGKFVRRTARFEGAAAEKARAAALHRLGHGESLGAVFDRARPGDHRELVTADGRIADAHHGFVRAQIERDQLVGLADADGFGDARHVFETRGIDRALVAGNANRGPGGARHDMRAVAELFDQADDVRDLAFPRAGFHDD